MLIPSQKSDVRLTFLQKFIVAAGAGCTSKTITSPLDVIHIRSQLGTWDTRQGTARAFLNLYKSEGIRAFWKGNALGCLRIMPYSSVQLVAFQRIKLAFCDRFGRLTPLSAGLSGAGGGLIATFVMYPSDTIKTRLIAQHTCPLIANYNGITDAAFTMLKNEGIISFYRGFSMSLIGVVPFAGVMFCAYEILDTFWEHYMHIRNNVALSLVNGCIAGSIAQTLTYPLDTVRRKMQAYSPVLWNHGHVDVPCKTLKQTLLETMKHSGVRGFWRGCLINNIKIVPYSGLMFFTYEVLKNVCIYHNGYTAFPWRDIPRWGKLQTQPPTEDYSHTSDEDIY